MQTWHVLVDQKAGRYIKYRQWGLAHRVSEGTKDPVWNWARSDLGDILEKNLATYFTCPKQ